MRNVVAIGKMARSMTPKQSGNGAMKSMRIEKLPYSMSRDVYNKKAKRYKYSQPRLSVPRPKSRFGLKKSFSDKSVLKRTRGPAGKLYQF
jgi:hypothetical protein